MPTKRRRSVDSAGGGQSFLPSAPLDHGVGEGVSAYRLWPFAHVRGPCAARERCTTPRRCGCLPRVVPYGAARAEKGVLQPHSLLRKRTRAASYSNANECEVGSSKLWMTPKRRGTGACSSPPSASPPTISPGEVAGSAECSFRLWLVVLLVLLSLPVFADAARATLAPCSVQE
jgi:hypothetical protein